MCRVDLPIVHRTQHNFGIINLTFCMFSGNKNKKCLYFISFLHTDMTMGYWNPSSCKKWNYLFHIVIIMGVDVLGTRRSNSIPASANISDNGSIITNDVLDSCICIYFIITVLLICYINYIRSMRFGQLQALKRYVYEDKFDHSYLEKKCTMSKIFRIMSLT